MGGVCDVPRTRLDRVAALLVGEAEWARRRTIPQERRALLALGSLASAALLFVGWACMPLLVRAAVWVCELVFWFVLVWTGLSVIALAIGALIQ